MPQDSKRKRYARKLRRSRTLAIRSLKESRMVAFNAHTTLLSVLAQQGGEVTVTLGTFQQVIRDVQKLNWVNAPGANGGEFIIRLVTEDTGSDATPAPPPTEASVASVPTEPPSESVQS